MNILVVGGSKAGAWSMRGVQLGAAIGARVTEAPTSADWSWADLVILVKRAGMRWASQAHAHKLTIVWDALDFWAQPAQNHLREADALALLSRTIRDIRPTVIIAATQTMAEACDGIYLPHHGWQGLTPTPPREQIATVAYDGGEPFLGTWRKVIQDACKARKWTFVIGPKDLSQVDVLLSIRDGDRDGWMCRQWKSGVKMVNAILAGRPLIRQPCAASDEIPAPGTVIETPADLLAAFDAWTPLEPRQAAYEACLAMAPAYTLDVIATQYQQILADVVQRQAVA